nr:DUF255 domain-containing protein [Heliorestis convoluta]
MCNGSNPKPSQSQSKQPDPFEKPLSPIACLQFVDWYQWCDEAFEKAKRGDKTVFLSICYSTCHWLSCR